MGAKLARFFHSFLNLFGGRSKDLRLESPLPKKPDALSTTTSPDDVEAREVRLPKSQSLPMKKEWEAFTHQPTLDLTTVLSNANDVPMEITYEDPSPSDIKYVLIAISSFGWKIARMMPSEDAQGMYKLKFNNPTQNCEFKFIVNDQWMTSNNYKYSPDGNGGQNNYI